MDDNLRTRDDRVREQYRDPSKLNSRTDLHRRFSTNRYPWQRWVFDQLDLPEDARILELGCGTAKLWTENRDRIPPRWNVTLSDISPEMLSEARDNITLNLSPTLNTNFTFIQTDARNLPFVEGEFDAVISNHMLYHIADRERVFSEVKRVLTPDGTFFAATNGEKNMEEMARFHSILNHEYRIGDETAAFNLENGGEQLGRCFSRVELRERRDGLCVTEAGPFFEYLLSMMYVREVSGSVSEAEFAVRTSALRADIEGEISARGALDITKSVGLFVAGG